jgi:hypothetical protein
LTDAGIIVGQLIFKSKDVGTIACTNGWKAHAPLQLLQQPAYPCSSFPLASGQLFYFTKKEIF